MVQLSGLPIAQDIKGVADLPHTLVTALQYRARINSFNELPEDKRPSRNLWDKPFRLKEFFDEVFDTKKTTSKPKTYLEFDLEDVE